MRIIAEIIEFQKKNATFRIFFCTFAPNSVRIKFKFYGKESIIHQSGD